MHHWHDLIYCGPLCHDDHAYAAYLDSELSARRAIVAAANAHQATCPTCGAPLPGEGVRAADPPKDVSADRGVVPTKDANIAREDAPSGWREPLL